MREIAPDVYEIAQKHGKHLVFHVGTHSFWWVDDLENEINLLFQSIEEYKRNNKGNLELDLNRDPKNISTFGKLTLISANSCNLACRYCYADEGGYSFAPKVMDPHTAINIVGKIITTFGEIPWIQFFGGEPLLGYTTIKAVVETFKDIDYTINTNGVLINDRISEFLKKNMKEIYISLDGPKEINDVNRVFKNGRGSFIYVEKGLKKLQSAPGDAKIIAEATYTREHLRTGISMVEIYEYLTEELGFDDAYITWAMYPPERAFTGKEWEFIINQYVELIKYTMSRNSKALLSSEVTGILYPIKKIYPCTAGLSTITVMPTGDVYPCYLLIEQKFWMGNVLSNQFPGPEFFKVRNLIETLTNKIKHPKCGSCILKYACVDCIGKRLHQMGDVYLVNPRECQLKREMFTTIAKEVL
ncbi:radical SAM/SPASM domain-containing protein [Thermococcus sp.]|uniref:radical SAM/SPASM domain-containing protein n=1 Tax=Thermococcus sp. TaxID=35749 RepID=UPI0025E0027D|nr:radical SAM protein [Thermococcus sp.]